MTLNAILLALFALGFVFWRLSFRSDDAVIAWIRWGAGFCCFVLGIFGSLAVWYLT